LNNKKKIERENKEERRERRERGEGRRF